MTTSQKKTLLLLFCAALLTAIAIFWLSPVPQLPDYHQFADQRLWLGIPHSLNVLSNIPFALAGIWGLSLLFPEGKIQFKDSREHWPWVGVSIGLILTAIGSGYYHLAPDDSSLFWDRLPMTIVFMSLIAALICEKIDTELGLWLWPLLLGLGFYSVFFWKSTGLHGQNDLSLYLGVQLFTALALLVFMFSTPANNRNWDLGVVLACYAFALVLDFSDHQVYKLTGQTISGHTLKHLFAALAGFWIIRILWKRKRENFR